ncbi:MAG: hypothetical protein EOO40_03315 [Deltaproteobacteria bacterium]|nr:MAG: hypothetical protein EOO40_03315 [Deltaproteobacteria bacterium]
MKYCLRAMVPALCLTFAACGNDAQLMDAQQRSEALANDDIATYDAVAFGSLEKGDEGSTTECGILRTKVYLQKTVVWGQGTWAQIGKTPQWQKLKGDHEQFDELGCTWSSTEPAGCEALQTTVTEDWKAVTELPEWTVLAKQDSYLKLHELIVRAKTLGCYKTPDQTADEKAEDRADDKA